MIRLYVWYIHTLTYYALAASEEAAKERIRTTYYSLATWAREDLEKMLSEEPDIYEAPYAFHTEEC